MELVKRMIQTDKDGTKLKLELQLKKEEESDSIADMTQRAADHLKRYFPRQTELGFTADTEQADEADRQEDQ